MRINHENYIVGLRKRNEKALTFIIHLYSPLVNGIVRKVLNPLKNEGIIEECISDVFISVWNNIDKFQGDENNFKSWIGGISKYKAIDYYRKNKSYSVESLLEDNEIISEDNVEAEVIGNEETDSVVKLINNLTEPDRSIFIMKFLYGYTSKKISQLLGLTVSNIDTRVNRGRKKLKAQYEKEVAYE